MHALGWSLVFCASLLLASSVVAAPSPAIYSQMIAQAAPGAEMSPCRSGRGPDGGPLCRNFHVTCTVSLPINEADRMNGYTQRKFVRAKFIWYMNQWIQADIAAEFAESKAGWVITQISLDDFGMDGRDKC